MKKILIFPAGTEIAFEILNALKYSKFVEVYGGTSADDHSEFVYKRLIKGFPYINDEGFLDYLNDVISKYDIDCIYPAHDSVSVFLSDNSDRINAQVIITDAFTTNICRSKKETYAFFSGESFIPRTFDSVEEISSYPVFVKPTVGQGSNGAKKISSRIELEIALQQDKSLVLCEYLPGMEYTVDCFTDRHGNLHIAKMRDRERIRSGISVRSKMMKSEPSVQDIAEKINSKLHFRGAWFFQLKRNNEGEYRLLEISPRIPGTMGLSRNSGINFPMLTLFDFWDFDVSVIDNDYDIILDRAFYNAYKIDIQYDHIYCDYDDTIIVNGKVNKTLISFLYQAKEQGKKIHLLSKHIGDLYEDLNKYCICKKLFDEIIVIDPGLDKTKYISEKSAIFIDDSFSERLNVKKKLGIAVFDLDMVESLIDWRII